MNIQQLIIYRHFVETKSVTKTAELIKIKQPTVSFHLKKIEESAGITLYEKGRESLVLTSAGRALYYYAHEIATLNEEATRVMKDFQENRRGELLLGSSHIPGNYILPIILKTFNQHYPNVRLTLSMKSTPITIEKIKDKSLDMALVSEQYLDDGDLSIKRLTDDPLVLVMKKNHPLAKKDILVKEDLTLYPFVLHQNGSTREMVDRWCRQQRLKLPISMEINSIEAIRQTVALGTGITILSGRIFTSLLEETDLTYRSIPTMPNNRGISLVFRKDMKFTPIRQYFYTLLQEKVK